MSYSKEAMDPSSETEKRRGNPHGEFLKQRNLGIIKKVLSGELTEDQAAEEITNREVELEIQRDHDSLTGLLNIHGFADALVEDLTIIAQNHLPAYLGFFDGDKLKEVNDTRGKVTGNTVIKTYASQLQQLTALYPHLSFLIGRFAGDEFMLLVIGASREEAKEVFEKLRSGIPGAVKEALNDPEIHNTISMGVVKVQPEDNAMTLIQRADGKLNEAKRDRNKVIFEEIPTTSEGR